MFPRDRRNFILQALAAGLVLASAAGASLFAQAQTPSGVRPGAAAPDFAAQGSDGKTHHLSDYRGSTVILEWTSPICEVTAQYYDSGKIQALQKEAARRKIVWLSINTAASNRKGYLTAQAADQLSRKRGATVTAFLFDPTGAVGRQFGAKATPSAYVINAKGEVVYQGAVAADPAGGANYLLAALDEIGAGKPVSLPFTPQRGCPVEY